MPPPWESNDSSSQIQIDISSYKSLYPAKKYRDHLIGSSYGIKLEEWKKPNHLRGVQSKQTIHQQKKPQSREDKESRNQVNRVKPSLPKFNSMISNRISQENKDSASSMISDDQVNYQHSATMPDQQLVLHNQVADVSKTTNRLLA